MTRPPGGAGDAAPRGRRPKSGRPEGRTTGRSELARHARFTEISPEVGLLDESALRRAIGEDAGAAFTLLVAMAGATDEALREQARSLAGRLVLERARAGTPTRGGTTRLRTVPAGAGGDVDVDASIEGIVAARAAARPLGVDDLMAREWGRPDTALVVVVDHSGSMTGNRLSTAAVVAAASALRAPAEHAVLAFAGQVEVLRRLGDVTPTEVVVDALLRLRGHGVTRLADALRAAGEQLATARARRRVVVLLSDCRATDDDGAADVARSLPELIVLAPAEDCEQAEHFAGQVGARWAPLTDPIAAAAVLDGLLG